MKNLLTIAGSDCSGGAGIQADLKTFAANGTYGMSVITAITAQNTMGVMDIHNVPINIITAQIDAIFSDIRVDGVKIGMLSNSEIVGCVADAIEKYQPKIVILDPVMVSTSGSTLLDKEAISMLKQRLIPLATVVTPNIPEAEVLTGQKIKNIHDMGEAAQLIGDMGANYVFIKGGHFKNNANDMMYNGRTMTIFDGTRIDTKNTHGTGCSISSAICANIAKGMDAVMAVGEAKKYVRTGIEHAEDIGHGNGPIHHFYDLWKTSDPNVEEEHYCIEKE